SRTDTRSRVIVAALGLMRRHGYAGTSISDVVAASNAPRGSVTFHFPGGKEEMAVEVVDLMTKTILDQVDQAAAGAETAPAVIAAQLARIGADFAASDFAEGCPVAPISIELGTQSDGVRRACDHFFTMWQAQLARRLIDRGLAETRAASIAAMTVYATEGAVIVCRSNRHLIALDPVAKEI